MTQSELADKLNLTRQAISRYETGDNFPDVSILVMIADIFSLSLDELIGSGEPTRTEANILQSAAIGGDEVSLEEVKDVLNLAPLLKPSILDKLALSLQSKGIDISDIIELAKYLNDDSVTKLLENADFESVSDELILKLMPLLDERSKIAIFQKIIEGAMDWRLIKILIPYAEFLSSAIEAAVVEGALPYEALNLMRQGRRERWEKDKLLGSENE